MKLRLNPGAIAGIVLTLAFFAWPPLASTVLRQAPLVARCVDRHGHEFRGDACSVVAAIARGDIAEAATPIFQGSVTIAPSSGSPSAALTLSPTASSTNIITTLDHEWGIPGTLGAATASSTLGGTCTFGTSCAPPWAPAPNIATLTIRSLAEFCVTPPASGSYNLTLYQVTNSNVLAATTSTALSSTSLTFTAATPGSANLLASPLTISVAGSPVWLVPIVTSAGTGAAGCIYQINGSQKAQGS